MTLSAATIDPNLPIIPQKSYIRFIYDAALRTGTGSFTPVIDLIGKAVDYSPSYDDVGREVPDVSGLLRADRIVPIRQKQTFKFKIEKIKGPGLLSGNLSGFKTGKVQLWITDPDDAVSTTVIKTNLFKCIAKFDGGLSLVMFEASEAVTCVLDAAAHPRA